MSPRLYRGFLPAFLASYAVGGFMTHGSLGGREIFPVFSWALYSDAPRLEVQYTVRLLEVDGRALGNGRDLMSMPGFHRSPDYWSDAGVVQNLGAALDEGDEERARALRRLVEANVLPGQRVRYELVKRTFDPLERRASGAFRETGLGEFVKDDPER